MIVNLIRMKNVSSFATFNIYSDYIIIEFKINPEEKEKQKIIPIDDIQTVFLRKYIQRSTAIEIFTYSRKSFFLNFLSVSGKEVIKTIGNLKCSNLELIQLHDYRPFFVSRNFTERWVNRQMSTFEYIMALNIYSGRSFNNPSIYPFFPWVLVDYTSKELDLTNSDVFRDFSKLVGAYSDSRREYLKLKYQEMCASGFSPFFFSSYISNPLIVYHYLIRMEPFTSNHIQFQGGRFDASARLFNSIEQSFHTLITLNIDYRELVPEFYTTPDFLLNSNQFDFGEVDKEKIDDVQLPLWADSPIDFIYKMRKALESQYVSDNINQWFDIIFGIKNRSYDDFSLFPEELYDDVWKNETKYDDKRIDQIEASLISLGQVPCTLR